MNADLTFEAQGRQPRTAIVLGLVWLALVFLYLRFDAAPWVLGIVVLFSLPAAWDLIANPRASMHLGKESVSWRAGRRDAEVPLSKVEHVRLDTRLDFSVRATFVLVTGRRLRVPFEATPPHETLEAALKARDVRVERHHFSLLG